MSYEASETVGDYGWFWSFLALQQQHSRVVINTAARTPHPRFGGRVIRITDSSLRYDDNLLYKLQATSALRRAACGRPSSSPGSTNNPRAMDINSLEERLLAYCKGEEDSLAEIKDLLESLPEDQRREVVGCRDVREC